MYRLHTMFAAAALLVLLFVQQQQLITLPESGRVASALPDALHGLWFALVTWLIALFVGRWRSGRAQILITALIGIGLALGTEGLQRLSGGDSQWTDVGWDMVGMVAALCILAARSHMLGMRLAASIALVLLTASLWPLVHAVLADRYRNSIAPELFGLDSVFARDLLRSTSTIEIVAPPAAWPMGRRVLRMTLADETYPGVHLEDPIDDWQPYTALVIDTYVDGPAQMPITISVRLDNAPVDHVYRTFDCAPGACSIVLPLEGLFDRRSARVNDVVIYSSRENAGRVVYLGRVMLQN